MLSWAKTIMQLHGWLMVSK